MIMQNYFEEKIQTNSVNSKDNYFPDKLCKNIIIICICKSACTLHTSKITRRLKIATRADHETKHTTPSTQLRELDAKIFFRICDLASQLDSLTIYNMPDAVKTG